MRKELVVFWQKGFSFDWWIKLPFLLSKMKLKRGTGENLFYVYWDMGF